MRRAERLFQIVQLIRGRRLSTARFLAERLEVSERTVYRDVADLLAQGVPIEGEAGVGYRMRAGFDLPPLMFTTDEARALVAAVRLAQPRLDTALAAQAEGASFAIALIDLRLSEELTGIDACEQIRALDADGGSRTIDRSSLRAVQTPQGFSTAVLRRAPFPSSGCTSR